MVTLSADEVQQLLRALDDDGDRRLVFVAVSTGLRLGELCGLKWGDLDWDARAASIRRSLQYLGSDGLMFRAPKSAAGRRSVALSSATVRTLREHRSARAERRLKMGSAYDDDDLILADPLGSPVKPYKVSERIIRQGRAAGYNGFRFHDLRHTMAALALRAGVHPKVVSERLGHANISITLQVYSHVLPDLQREAADALDEVLDAAQGA